MECPVCLDLYDTVDQRPVSGKCGHAVCSRCAQSLEKCPICREPRSFSNPTVNFLAMEQLTQMLHKEEETQRAAQENIQRIQEIEEELQRRRAESEELSRQLNATMSEREHQEAELNSLKEVHEQVVNIRNALEKETTRQAKQIIALKKELEACHVLLDREKNGWDFLEDIDPNTAKSARLDDMKTERAKHITMDDVQAQIGSALEVVEQQREKLVSFAPIVSYHYESKVLPVLRILYRCATELPGKLPHMI